MAWQVRYWQRTLRYLAVQKNLAHRIRAEVKLAQVHWRQSCPVSGQGTVEAEGQAHDLVELSWRWPQPKVAASASEKGPRGSHVLPSRCAAHKAVECGMAEA